MSGGMLQLVARGNENIFLTDNPEITLFKRVYRRHTDFSTSYQNLKFNKKIPFGGEGQCEIKKNGDLVHKLMLMIDIPDIYLQYIQVTNKSIADILSTYNIKYDYTLNETHNTASIVITTDIYTTYILPLIETKVNELVGQINSSQEMITLLDDINDNSTHTTAQDFFNIFINGDSSTIPEISGQIEGTEYESTYNFIESYKKDIDVNNKSTKIYTSDDMLKLTYSTFIDEIITRKDSGTFEGLVVASTGNTLTLDSAASLTSTDIYKNWLVKVNSQVARINTYDPGTNMITIMGYWKYPPLVNEPYVLINIPHVYKSGISDGNVGAFKLSSEHNVIYDYFSDWYVYDFVNSQLFKIIGYDNDTLVGIFNIPWGTLLESNDACLLLKQEPEVAGDYTYLTTTTIQLDSNASITSTDYTGYYIVLDGQIITISSFDTVTLIATLGTSLSTSTIINYTYEIFSSDAFPTEIESDIFPSAPTLSTAQLASTSSSTSGYYNGWYILSNNQIIEIDSYDHVTQTVTLMTDWIDNPSINDKYVLHPTLPTSVESDTTQIIPNLINHITSSNYVLSSVDGKYNGWMLIDTTNNQLQTIKYYYGKTKYIITDDLFITDISEDDSYVLVDNITPTEVNIYQDISTTSITLNIQSSPYNDTYVNKYVRIGNYIAQIILYDGVTKVATFSSSLASVPSDTTYKIYDNLTSSNGNDVITGTFGNLSNNVVVLSSSSSSTDGYYVKNDIVINNEVAQINYYDGNNKIALLSVELTGELDGTNSYDIYDVIPKFSILDNATNYGIKLNLNNVADTDDYYNMWYVHIGSQIQKISSYDGPTKTATLNSSWIENPHDVSNYILYETLTETFNGSFDTFTSTTITLDDTSASITLSTTDDEYVDYHIHFGKQIYKIIAYDGLSYTVTLDTTILDEPTGTTSYIMYEELTINEQGETSSIGNKTVSFNINDVVTQDKHYNGTFMKFDNFISQIDTYFGENDGIAVTFDTWNDFNIPSAGSSYVLFRRMLANFESDIISSIETDNNIQYITLGNGTSNIDDFYKNWYFRVKNKLFKIDGYDSNTHKIKINQLMAQDLSGGDVYYLYDKSLEDNILFYHILDNGNYPTNKSTSAISLKVTFNGVLDYGYNFLQPYDYIGSYKTYEKYFDELITTGTTNIISTKSHLLETILWNAIANINQFKSILKALKTNSTNSNDDHFRFVTYKEYTYESNENYLLSTTFHNISPTGTDTTLDDNFTQNISIDDLSSPITSYFSKKVSELLATFHLSSKEYFNRDIFREYFSNFNFWVRTKIPTIQPSITDTYLSGVMLMNYIPILVNNDVPSYVNYNLSKYLTKKYPSYDFTTFLYKLKTTLNTLSTTLNSTLVTDLGLSLSDQSYLTSINSLYVQENNLTLTSIFRPEILYSYNDKTNLFALDYVIEYMIDTATTQINNYDYSDDAYISSLYSTSFVEAIISELTKIINCFRTSEDLIPTYSNYVANNNVIYSVDDVSSFTHSTENIIIPTYSDAISSIWYNIHNNNRNLFNGLFSDTLLSNSYYDTYLGSKMLSMLNHTSELINVNLANITDFYSLDTDKFDDVVELMNDIIRHYKDIYKNYTDYSSLLKIKNIHVNNINYYYESFDNMFDIVTTNITSKKSLYYPVLSQTSTDIIYDDTYVDNLFLRVKKYLGSFVVGALDILSNTSSYPVIDSDMDNYDFIRDSIETEFSNAVSSATNPYNSSDNPNLYAWYDTYVDSGSYVISEMQTSMDTLINSISPQSLYRNKTQISSQYTSFLNEIYLEQYLMDVEAKNVYGNIFLLKKDTWDKTYESLYSHYNNILTTAQTTYDLIVPTLNTDDEYESSELDTLLLSMINKDDPSFAWVRYLGYFLIDRISLSINDEVIDSQTGEFMYIYNNINDNTNHTRGTNICIGNVESMYTYNNDKKKSYQLTIPLYFWFCQDISMSIPLCALQHSDIRLTLKTKTIDKIAYWNNSTTFTRKPVINASVMAEYIYVDKEERFALCDSRMEQLINIVQYAGDMYFSPSDINEITNTIECDMAFDNMCTELLWFIQPVDNIDGSLDNGEIRPWDFMFKTGTISKSNTNTVYNNSSYSLVTKSTTTDTKVNPFKSLSIKLNGRTRESDKDYMFYESVIPVTRHKTSGLDGLMNYCFNIHPEWTVQPSGAMNCSKAYEFSLVATLNPDFQNDITNSKKHFRWGVYAIQKNHLRIMSGLAGKAFL